MELGQNEMQAVLNRITDGFIVLDDSFKYVYANKRIGEITGQDPAALIGKYVWDVFPEAKGSATYIAFNEAFEKQHYVYNVDHYEPLDLWQENHIYPSPEGLTVIIRDISEQKRTENKLQESVRQARNVFLQNPLPMWVLDLHDFRFLDVNEAALKLYGYTRSEFMELTALDIRPEAEKERFKNLPRQPATTPTAIGVWTHLKKDGTPILVEINATDMIYENRPGRLVMVHDVTEREQTQRNIAALNATLESRVTERTAELQRSNAELEALSYTISHDLKSPLRAINGLTSILLEEYSSDWQTEAKDLLQHIISNANNMGLLIQHVLDFAKLGKTPLTRANVNMQELVSRVIEQLQPKTTAAFELLELPPVEGDATTLQQVWQHLLENAVKFSAHNPNAHITIGTTVQDNELVYYVKDNGSGFDMAYSNKLFGVFQRLHNPHEFTGAGIGLATVKRIIQRHRGRIWAQGEKGKGATFYFTLPG